MGRGLRGGREAGLWARRRRREGVHLARAAHLEERRSDGARALASKQVTHKNLKDTT
jgi:hypothetical protein